MTIEQRQEINDALDQLKQFHERARREGYPEDYAARYTAHCVEIVERVLAAEEHVLWKRGVGCIHEDCDEPTL